ncbi:GTPase-activating protein gyp8 [Gnomoniopsis smithogilvyi]|uniref:GTPase-activating protein gyp8 n=1 Tax=Gnomoniopsis smithogilvyi TaxID=1191159 RepID=A0A9W8YUJ0_9PEZI|nr:GTPase-activating protein gyp8 [Gnomoniopsis smithogilvyi]
MAMEDKPPASQVPGGEDTRPHPTDDISENYSAEDEPKPSIRNPKEDEILDACHRRDIAALQSLAISTGGFVTDSLRQQASDESWKSLAPHKDESQVQLDVERSFVYYPDYSSEKERAFNKDRLSDLILSVLRRYPYIHYFQGYHDIAQVFLLVLPPRLRCAAVSRLSLLRIRDFMLPNLKAAISQLRLIPSILRAADPKLWAHLSQTEPFFALSGTLTMYAHDVQSQNEITRLFDVLLAREPVFSVYMFAQIVLNRRAELFETEPDEPEMLHSILSKLPQPLNLEALITSTSQLFDRYPPEKLGSAWNAGISEHSVLKTARSTQTCAGQSEAVGGYFFTQQVLELQRAERMERVLNTLWKYRRPAGAAGVAVLVTVLAYWLRRSTVPSGMLGHGQSLGQSMSTALSKWWYRAF